MTDYKQIARDAIACGLLVPPAPPKKRKPYPVLMTVRDLRPYQKPDWFAEEQRRKQSHICARPTCGKPAKWSEKRAATSNAARTAHGRIVRR